MIKIISEVHKERIVHRDIKPENFLIGNTVSNMDELYIIDFGLSKMYKN